MLVAERHQKIIEMVNTRFSIRVTELSNFFSVTEETIRRDLEKLEKEYKLKRSHGGAISIQQDQETDFSQRQIEFVKEKKAIALEAMNYIEQRDRIILDASTTALYMAAILPDIPLTVLTNSINVALELSKKEKITVISTGGILLPRSLSYVGPLAESSLENYYVNKAFISCRAVHLHHGLTDSHESQARLKKRMMDIAEQTFLMVDSSKFGSRTFAQICDVKDCHHIITDSKMDAWTKKGLVEKNIRYTEASIREVHI